MDRQRAIVFVVVMLLTVGLLLLSAAEGYTDSLRELTPSLPSGQPVGTTIRWMATAMAGLSYQFSIARDGEDFLVVRDFSSANSFLWTPIDEGDYSVRVVTQQQSGTQAEAIAPFVVLSRVTGSGAVITATEHPLVALYSAPPCTGHSIHVEFSPVNGLFWVHTSPKPCRAAQSMNFYVAGMQAASPYRMRHVIVNESSRTRSPTLLFTTGTPAVSFPSFPLLDPPDARSSWVERVILHTGPDETRPQISFPVATDLMGRVLWYYDKLLGWPKTLVYLTRPVAGGTMLLLIVCCSGPEHILAEVDLAGHTVRQTTMSRINAQLVARGEQTILGFSHEAVRFPNGQTLLLGFLEQPGDPPTMGDLVIALDANLQVVWTWNAFDHLDPGRQAVLHEPCWLTYGPLCPASTPLAQDWLHSNSLAYSPQDGNLIVSLRHQDWVIKLDYQDGTGTGQVLWRLGREGDFTIVSTDALPWFSHQHDATYIDRNRIALYDNGNTRCFNHPQPCSSRGQVLELDEVNRVAILRVNVDLGVYSPRRGSAQRLTNGNFQFGSGFVVPDLVSRSTEVTPEGSVVYNLQADALEYRLIRMRSLYEP